MTEAVMPTQVVTDAGKVPISALQITTRNLLSCALNPLKIIPADNGLPRDWRGLAHLTGLKVEKIPVIFCDPDPTARVLILWQKQEKLTCTIKQLQDYLAELDRYDVIDDIAEMIEKDISSYFKEPQQQALPPNPAPFNNDVDRHILTVDDVIRIESGLGTQIYDAFVVFADEDIDFAMKLIEIMENQYGLKLCVKERDLVVGLPFEHKAIIELISERCHRLIVIISPAYLKSPANKFVVNYAQALGIEQGKRKIIPCLYENCVPPQELRHIFMLNYPRSGRLYNFWEKLYGSIQVPGVTNPLKFKCARPVSQEISVTHNESLHEYKSLPLQEKDYLKPKKESVKFGSLTDITCVEALGAKKSASVHALNADSSSTSTESSVKEHKKTKSNLKIFKNIFKQKDEEKKKKKNVVDANGKKWAWFNKKYKMPMVN